MISKYIDNINTSKEVLESLPKNNVKNIKIYEKKLDDLTNEYENFKKIIEQEIEKRYQGYLSTKTDNDLKVIYSELENLYNRLPLINNYSSCYEKSGLDVVLYKLEHFKTLELEDVNKEIIAAFNIFNNIGVKLQSDDFNYSYYSSIYLNKFLYNVSEEELRECFDQIYWKCPNIINYIALNFKYLYFKYEKDFIKFYDELGLKLQSEDLYNKYVEIYKKYVVTLNNDKFIILNKFLNKELSIADYTNAKVKKAYANIVDAPVSNEFNDDILKLSYSLFEYKSYLDFRYIINDTKELFKNRDKNKNLFNKGKKEIAKKEFNLFRKNSKLMKLLNKGNIKKFEYEETLINNLLDEIKNKYDELETNYFYEKINKLGEDATLYDLLYLLSSSYVYLAPMVIKNDKMLDDEFNKLKEFVYYPYINIINHILINEDKDIRNIIMDRYNLFGLDISSDEIDEDNISSFIHDIEIVLNSISMSKLGLDNSEIKFIEEARKILNIK